MRKPSKIAFRCWEVLQGVTQSGFSGVPPGGFLDQDSALRNLWQLQFKQLPNFR